MAGFEVIVRPMIFPGIRPAPRPSVPPAETDPDKGLVVIRGQSARTVELPYSYSLTWSEAQATLKEKSRTVDKVRVYQEEPDGTVNKGAYIDVEVAKKIQMQDLGNGAYQYFYSDFKPEKNMEIIQKNVFKKAAEP